jgi:type IV pilus assembly protein PilB
VQGTAYKQNNSPKPRYRAIIQHLDIGIENHGYSLRKIVMRKMLGEVLVDSGLITMEQLENALTLRKSKNKRLGKILFEVGYATEAQIADALSKQQKLPLVDCNEYEISKDLLELVPKNIAEKAIVLPLQMLKGKKLLLAMADPLDWSTIDDITFRTGLTVQTAVSTETALVAAIEKHYGSDEKSWDLLNEIPQYDEVEFLKEIEEEGKEVNVQSLFKLSEAPPIVKLVTMVIVDAVKSRASDIHIEPQEQFIQVRYRVDGDLRSVLKYPKRIQDSVISRIKIISNLDITNRRTSQDGRSTLRIENRNIDLRISTLPSIHGENVVIRLLDHTSGLIPLSKLGVTENILNPLIHLASQPQGMILVTGPTGSGKTTTLYSLLKQLRTETESIFTIEDPVEYRIPGITQVGVNEATNMTFPAALRSILRQDPDIIMVGEIRDLETASIAIRSALTGHLVLATVHTNDSVATIIRLMDIGLDAYLVSSGVTGILAQRLVRRICPECKVETDPPEILTRSKFPPLKIYYKGKGCPSCQYTGYRGQIGVFEFLQMDTKLRRLIAKNTAGDNLWDVARASGVKPLFENAWAMVEKGITTVDEVIMKIPYKLMEGDSRKHDKIQKAKVLAFNLPEADSTLIRNILEAEGYEVSSASGDDIVEATRKEQPDVILVNASPEWAKSVKKLRSDIRYVYTPIFVLSEKPADVKQKDGIELGIKGALSRPIDQARLLDLLRRGSSDN